jgi:hypothetical protein
VGASIEYSGSHDVALSSDHSRTSATAPVNLKGANWTEKLALAMELFGPVSTDHWITLLSTAGFRPSRHGGHAQTA